MILKLENGDTYALKFRHSFPRNKKQKRSFKMKTELLLLKNNDLLTSTISVASVLEKNVSKEIGRRKCLSKLSEPIHAVPREIRAKLWEAYNCIPNLRTRIHNLKFNN